MSNTSNIFINSSIVPKYINSQAEDQNSEINLNVRKRIFPTIFLNTTLTICIFAIYVILLSLAEKARRA